MGSNCTTTFRATTATTTMYIYSLSTKSKLHSLIIPSISNLNFNSSTNLRPITHSYRPNTLPILKSSTSSTPTDTSTTTITSHRNLKSRLRFGETLYGLFLLSFSPTVAEIAGLAGYDFVVIDMEHGHGGISDALPCLHALAASSTAAILCVPETTAAWAKKALDLGPQGIMFPMLESAKSAAKAVSYCRFPPAG